MITCRKKSKDYNFTLFNFYLTKWTLTTKQISKQITSRLKYVFLCFSWFIYFIHMNSKHCDIHKCFGSSGRHKMLSNFNLVHVVGLSYSGICSGLNLLLNGIRLSLPSLYSEPILCASVIMMLSKAILTSVTKTFLIFVLTASSWSARATWMWRYFQKGTCV